VGGYKMIECPNCQASDDENIATIFNVAYVKFEETDSCGFGMRQMRCPACSYQFLHFDSDDEMFLLLPFLISKISR